MLNAADTTVPVVRPDGFDSRLLPLYLDTGFPEVPDSLFSCTKWRTITCKPVFEPEAIHVLEGRAVLHRVRQIVSHLHMHHRKHLI